MRIRAVAFRFGIALAVLLIVCWFWPLSQQLSESSAPLSVSILDRNGQQLYVLQRGGQRDELAIYQIPEIVRNAVIAIEDRSFLSHHGLSLRGIGRAVLHDIQAQGIVEGGSTITQQLVHNLLNPGKRSTIFSKIFEAWLALKLDASETKERTLERYLNTVYFGQQSYGIQAAATTYFGKNVSELSLGESALLAGLLNAPTALNPFKDSAAAKTRRNLVLNAMKEVGFISDSELQEAAHEPLALSHGKILIRAPHFVFWQLQQHPEVFTGNTTSVTTTLDLHLQTDIEAIITRQLAALADKNVTSAAVVVLDAKNGDVLAMAGSADYFDDAHDGAVNVALSSRQPGSALKPFTYALGLSSGMTAATTVADTEARFLTQEGNPYTPRNYDFMYHGLVRLREALANSYNIAAVKVLEQVGVASLLSFLKNAGITTLRESPEHYGLALTLGDSEVKLLELAKAYGIFATLGKTLPIRTLETDPMNSGTALLDPRVAWLISDILSDNDARTEQFGQTSALHFDFPVAAKTGTTRNSRDNWTIGFTPTRIVGVWVGNADNTPMKGTSGVTGAGPIFHDVMLAAMQNQPKEWFPKPDGIVDKVICRLSGKLMTPLCPSSLNEHFILGTEPKLYDDMYREVELDVRTGLLASDTCPKNQIKKELFTFFPIELQRWARDNGWKQPPNDYSPLCPPSIQSSHSSSSATEELMITSPSNNAVFKMDPLIPDSSEKIFLEARAPSTIQSVEWFVDGHSIGTAKQPDFHLSWQILSGSHRIEAKSQKVSDSVSIKVTQ